MDTLAEIKDEIIFYLKKGSHPHLADCLDMVAPEYIEALYDMINALQQGKKQQSVISLQVSEDMAALVEGKPDAAQFLQSFLNTKNEEK